MKTRTDSVAAGEPTRRASATPLLQLVRGAKERRAMARGEVDAIIDPYSGQAILLPEARLALRDVNAQRVAPSGSAVLDAIGMPACLLDDGDLIIACNRAWQEQHISGCTDSLGTPYLALCDGNDEARLDEPSIAAGIAQVRSDARAQFRYEYAPHNAGAHTWLRIIATPLLDDDVRGVLICHKDLSAARLTDQWMRLESEVACRLAVNDDADVALLSVLEAICTAFDWARGQYLASNSAGTRWHQVSVWHCGDAHSTAHRADPHAPSGRADAGLAGRVRMTGQPLWIRGHKHDVRRHLALPHEFSGPCSFAWPVVANDILLGVLLFDIDNELPEPDEATLRSVGNIGLQLAHFLRRDAVAAHLREENLRLNGLTQLSADWCWEIDRDFRFTRTTSAGIGGVHEILGKTLWELPHVIASDVAWLEFRAALAARWTFCDYAFETRHPDGRVAHYLVSGEPTFDEHGQFRGFQGVGVNVTRRDALYLSRQCAADVTP